MPQTVAKHVLNLKKQLELATQQEKTNDIEDLLKQLRRAPITADDLLTTGVGKTVNSLRKHDRFGTLAKEIVRTWKQIADDSITSSTPPTHRHNHEPSEPASFEDALERTTSPSKRKTVKVPPAKTRPEIDDEFERAFHSVQTTSSSITPPVIDYRSKYKIKKKSSPPPSPPRESRSSPPSPLRPLKLDPVEINLNYRPLPPSTAEVRKRPQPSQSDEDSGYYAKKRRILKSGGVYSGNRGAVLTGDRRKPPTLFEMCIEKLSEHIDLIEQTGVPFPIIRSVLDRCSPTQLLRLEHFNPEYVEEGDELWQKHVARDFHLTAFPPGGAKTWRSLYLEKQKEQADKLKLLTASIARRQKADQTAQTTTGLMSVVKTPREILRRQQRHLAETGGIVARPSQASARFNHVQTAQQAFAPAAKKKMAPMMAKSLKMLKMNRR